MRKLYFGDRRKVCTLRERGFLIKFYLQLESSTRWGGGLSHLNGESEYPFIRK
jgi:hypothetical protein